MRALWLWTVGRAIPVVSSLCFVCLSGCDNGSGPSASSNVQVGEVGPVATSSSPNLSFAKQLGISAGPVTSQDARGIAELATGGSALSVEREDEDAVATFDVMVRVGLAMKDVEIRISDGAVLKIEDESTETDDSEGEDESGEEVR